MAAPIVEGGYTVSQLAAVLHTTPRTIRSFVRDGLLRGDPAEVLPLGFRDLIWLKLAIRFARATTPARARRALRALRDRLPTGTDLSSVQMELEGGALVVREGERRFAAESGQGLLGLQERAPARVMPLSRRVPAAVPGRGPDDWYELGLMLEENEQSGAEEAYARALALDPGHADAAINLGRLRHQRGDPRGAARLYVQALESRPEDAMAVFNLGVVLEDLGEPHDAVAAYEQAVSLDPTCADAHYNAARLYESLGDTVHAVRHLARYRQLTR